MASNEVDRDSITLVDLLDLHSLESPKVKKSKKKKERVLYSEEQVQQALYEIENGTMSLRKASIKYNVPRSTLVFRRSSKFTKIQKGPRPVLTKEEEDQLAMWILAGETYGAPRRYSQIQEWVQRLLNEHPRDNVPFPDNKPRRGWLKSFMRRHPELNSMKNISFDDHCEIVRANVKKVALEDVTSNPEDIISESIAKGLVDTKDVASLRRAFHRTRGTRQEKNQSMPSTSFSTEPLTTESSVGERSAQVFPKLEIIDSEYEPDPQHLSYIFTDTEDYNSGVRDTANESRDSVKASGSITGIGDLNITPEPGSDDGEDDEPAEKQIKLETYDEHDLDYPGECSTSFVRPESSQSSVSHEFRPAAANSSHLSEDVEYFPQTSILASQATAFPGGHGDPPVPNRLVTTGFVERRDRSDIFGEYVAAKMRSLKTDAARNRVECLVANILFEASMGKFDDSESTFDITAELQSFITNTRDLQTLKKESFPEGSTREALTADEVVLS